MVGWRTARLTALTAAAIVAGAARAHAQEPPRFRSGTALVRLDVRVLDRDGTPVRGLTAADLRVEEDGRERPILFFQPVDEPAGSPREIVRQTAGGEVSTNRGAPRGHLYVLVFDQQHITPGNEMRARAAAERFLRTRVRPGDRVAVYAMPGPGPNLGFTGDIDRAVATLPSIRGSLERVSVGVLGTMRVYEAYEIARGNEPLLNRVAAQIAMGEGASDSGGSASAGGPGGGVGDPSTTPRLVQEDARTIVAQHDEVARQFLRGLEALVDELRPIEGRKAVVLVSEGFFIDHVTRELEAVAAAAARSYGVVYALDVNRRGDAIMAPGPANVAEGAETLSRLEPLGSLAVETAGRLFIDATSRLDTVLGQIVEESQAYYLVGFAPADDARRSPGLYRRVRVSVTRPGLRVSTRTGYAIAPEPTPADRRRAVELALRAPFPLQEIPLDVTTYTMAAEPDGRARVVMVLDAHLPAAGDHDAADVVFAVRRARDGTLAASGSDALAPPALPAAGAAADRSRYTVQFGLPPGEYLMRVVVREPGGLVGSVDRRFSIPSRASREVVASDLVFSAPEGGLAVRPWARTGEMLVGGLELYGGTDADLAAARVMVDLSPVGGGPSIAVAAEPLDPQPSSGGRVRPVRVEVPLGGAPPGAYIARAMVRVRGEATASVTRDVEIRPASAAGPARPPAIDLRSFDVAEVLAGRVAAQADADAASSPETAARFAAGRRAFGARDFGTAIQAWSDVLRVTPTAARVAFLLGWAHVGAGDTPAAIGAWRSAVQADPRLVPAHLAIIDTFLAIDERDLAEHALRTALAASPDAPELQDRLLRLGRR